MGLQKKPLQSALVQKTNKFVHIVKLNMQNYTNQYFINGEVTQYYMEDRMIISQPDVLSDIAKKPYSTKPQCQQLKALWETAKL
jgi:hypothetical protein